MSADERDDETSEHADPAGSDRDATPAQSSEPPVPGEDTPAADTPAEAKQASEEVTDERGAGDATAAEAQAGSAEAGAQPGPEHGIDPHAPVQVLGVAEAGVPDDLRERIEEIISRYPQRRSAAIPALFAVQQRYGWCTPEGIRQAAAVMEVTPAYLESVASFYDLFHLEPAGEHRLLVCTNISCWMRGADELLDAVCEATGADRHGAGHGGVVNEAGDIFVSGFECLGACDIAPMVSVDERYLGPVEPGEVPNLIEQLRAGEEVLPDKALARRTAAGGPEPAPDPRVAEAERS
jgi:NADH-quinone oxidoreductase subunit E